MSIQPSPTLNSLLNRCRRVFVSANLAHTSRKLYLADIKRFLRWSEARHTLTPTYLTNPKLYQRYLLEIGDGFTPSLRRRTLASLRRLGTVIAATYSMPNPTTDLTSTLNQQPSADYLKSFTNYLKGQQLTAATIKSYKSDTSQYLAWLSQHFSGKDFARLLTIKNQQKYLNYLTKLDKYPSSTLNRKHASLARFHAWYQQAYPATFSSDNIKLAPPPSSASHAPRLSSSKRPSQDPAPRPFHSRTITASASRFSLGSTLSLGLIILLTAGLAVFGYQAFSRDQVLPSAAYPTTPVTPNRQLSFQGRLEDSGGTPITSSTNLIFKLYDAAGTGSPPTGGTELYSSGTCAITPDTDGVFSTQIGADCGSGIASSVFSENADVYLQVTVAGETLSPRQQIATVAYALNAETVQGIPLSSTMSAIANTLVPMNSGGEIVIGEQSPTMRAVSGTFNIQAPALSLTTASGTSGNLSLAPDGTGQINATGNTTTTNFFNISNAQLTTGSLLTGTVANNNTGFNLLDLLSGSSPTSKFSVTDSGLTTVAADLYVSSGISLYNNAVSDDTVEAAKFCTGDGESNCVTDFSTISSGAAIWTDGGTYLYPTNGEVLGNSASAGSNKLAGLYLGDSSPLVFGADNDLTYSFNNTSSTLEVTLGSSDLNFDSNTLFIDGSADRVGIGTTTTTDGLLTLVGGSVAQIYAKGSASNDAHITLDTTTAGYDSYLRFREGGSTKWVVGNEGSDDSFRLGYGATPTNVITALPTSGYVGIGTTAPDAKLSLSNNVAAGGLDNFSEYQLLLYSTGTASTSYGLGIRSGTMVFNSNFDYQFDTGGVTSVTFDSGLVGIGDTTPASLLTVGNGDLFQVNSSGIIAAVDGVAHTIDDVSGNLTLTSNSTTLSLNDNTAVTGTLDVSGYAAIGDSVSPSTTDTLALGNTSTANNATTLNVTKTSSQQDVTQYSGFFTLNDTATTDSTIAVRFPLRTFYNKTGSAAQTGYENGGLFLYSNVSGGSLTNLMNTESRIQVPTGGTVTNARHFYISPDYSDGLGTVSEWTGFWMQNAGRAVTNQYGIYLNSLTSGTSSNYAIYTNAGAVRFGDNVTTTGDLTLGGGNLNTGDIPLIVGDATTDTITLLTDGTGNGEVVLPNDSIGPSELLSTGLTDEYCLTYEATGSTWEWQTCGTGGGGTSYWDLNSTDGTLYPVNSTVDLLLGGTATSSAKLAVTNLNSGTPTLKFNQASAVDLYDATVNSLNFESGLLSLDTANSRIGIGTTTPSTQFHLYKSGANADARIETDGAANVAKLVFANADRSWSTGVRGDLSDGFSIYSESYGASRLFVDGTSNGYLGVGTTSPQSILHVKSGADTSVLTGLALGNETTSATGGVALDFRNHTTTTQNTARIIAQRTTAANSNSTLQFWNFFNSSLQEAMRINETGYLGIGDTSPDHTLDVEGNIGLSAGSYLNWGDTDGSTGYGFRDNSGSLEFKDSGGSWTDLSDTATSATIWTDGGTYLYPTNGEVLGNSASAGSNKLAGLYLGDSSPLVFGADNDFSFSFSGSTLGSTLASGTRLGINTTSALATLDVRASLGTIPVASISGNTALAALIVDQSGSGDIFAASTSGQTRFVVAGDGNVGIGVQDPTSKLEIGGTSSTLSNSSGNITIDSAGGSIVFGEDDDLIPTLGASTATLGSAAAPWDALYTGAAYFGGGTTYYVDSSGNAKFLDLQVTDTGNPGLTVGNGTIGFIKVGGSTISDNGGDLTLDSDTGLIVTVADDLAINGGNITTAVTFDSTATVTGDFTANANTTLGDAITDTLTFTARVAQESDLIPITTTGTNDLGSSSLPWDNLYTGAAYFGGTTYYVDGSGNANFNALTAEGTTTLNGIMNFGNGSSDTVAVNSGAWTFAADTNFVLSGGVNGLSFNTNTLSIDALNGRVGIGNTAPSYTLDVAGTVGIDNYIYHNTDSDTYQYFSPDRIDFTAGAEMLLALHEDSTQDYVEIGDDGDVDIKLSGGTDAALFVEGSTGNVAIGSLTSPASELVLYEADSTASVLLIQNLTTGTTSSDGFYVGINVNEAAYLWNYENTNFGIATNNTEQLTILSTGEVGIGQTSPNQGKVEVKGGTVCVDTNSDNNATSCIASESDVRLKKNILPIGSALDKITKLSGVEFDWRLDDPTIVAQHPLITRFVDQPHSIGLIAQDVERIFPELIGEEINGFKQLRYELLVAPLIQAVKELNAKVDGNQRTLSQELTRPLTTSSLTPTSSTLTVSRPPSSPPSSDPLLVVQGGVTADSLSARNAKLNSLEAEIIRADQVIARSLRADSIEGLDAKLATLSASTSLKLSDQELSTITDRIKSRLADLSSPTAADLPAPTPPPEPPPAPAYQLDSVIATDSATLASLDTDLAVINDYLAVVGSATINSLEVTGYLYSDTLTAKSGQLALQPDGGSVRLAANTLVVDSLGEVTVNGSLTVHGRLLADSAELGSLSLGRPPDASASALGRLLSIYDEQGQAVATIDSSGSANLRQLSTELITIASPATSATESSSLAKLLDTASQSNATAGEATLSAGTTQLTIKSPHITPDSLVYLTPTGNTDNKVLFVKSKHSCPPATSSCTPAFTVGVDTPARTDLSFNWWIIRLATPRLP